MKIPMPVLFALGTALCWGLYGPTLGNARSPERLYSPFKPYVGIGLAYLVIAIVGGAILMKVFGDTFSYSGKHAPAGTWGFLAGCLGALGALCLTTAMFKGGAAMPHVVMPVVFGGAVTVNALVSVYQQGKESTNPLLWVGIVGMAVCIVLVASNTPHAHPPKKPAATAEPTAETPAAEAEKSE